MGIKHQGWRRLKEQRFHQFTFTLHFSFDSRCLTKTLPVVSNASLSQGEINDKCILLQLKPMSHRAEEIVQSWRRENISSRYKDLDLLMNRKRLLELALLR